ncbi:hypothetical protein AMTR_s00049p00012970 [Amborella trichopoda]|uniref:Uncharacterized protein n=1 Tax=Amborella trichopoda TaxID=13333 RepID=W1PYY2_AMBTC|nr:hypothetical protein AMTR_s00049p00012970 [Amborella trichopoda]
MAEDAAFPGGPEIPSMLTRQREHISQKIREGDHKKNTLKIDEKPNASVAWPLTNNDQIDLVKKSRLSSLTIVLMNQHDRNTLSTIIEKWRAKMNTRHFNVTGVAVTVRRVENYDEHIIRMIGQLPPGHSHSFI